MKVIAKGDSFLFAVANTHEEKNAIFRFRYDIYVAEMKRQQSYANHIERIVREPIDDYSTLLMAINNNRIVGCSRITCHQDFPLTLANHYKIDELLSYCKCRVSEGTKLMIKKELRGNGSNLGELMLLYGYNTLRELNISFDFLNANLYLERYYASYGYRRCGNDFTHPELNDKTVPMILAVNDVEYLRKIDSPLLKIAKKYANFYSQQDILNMVYGI